MRIASPGHAIFALTFVSLGIMGLVESDFTAVWHGAPPGFPARRLLASYTALVSVFSGLGLLFRPTAAFASRALWVSILLWLCVFKIPVIIKHPLEEVAYQSAGQNAVLMAAAWVLYAWFASDWEKQRLGFVVGDNGVHIARVFYALALIAFGLSHFVYLNMTAPLVPAWLGWSVGWAYLTGCTYLAAGAAVLLGVYARLAATLSAIQIGLITILVWGPLVAAGELSAFRWQETIFSCGMTAGAWVLADSYRGMPWFAIFRR